ncbi:hypothetical protein [Streptosporangium vulgare]|uniref:hypothetical protein n=1 Tax=Streptosporangium vulgare TaxID=46190 RepID=UPI0031CE5995
MAGIRQDIADIKAANPEVDFSALEAKVGALEGLDAEYPAVPPQEPETPGRAAVGWSLLPVVLRDWQGSGWRHVRVDHRR